MGFTITSSYAVKGVSKTGYYCTMKRKLLDSNSRITSEGKTQYYVRYTKYIFADYLYYLANRNTTYWNNDAVEEELVVTYDEFIGNVRTAIYTAWKAELSGCSFSDDSEPSVPVMDLYSVSNDLNVPNSNCKYYVIRGSAQIATIHSNDFKADDVLTLQFTDNITLKHATAGSYSQLALSGSADFAATNKCKIQLTFDGSSTWNETLRSIPS